MKKLLKCEEYNEIFEIAGNGHKCWIQDWETFIYLGYRIQDVEKIPFDELRDNYPVGPTKIKSTITTIVEGKEPKDIFYPGESENPYSWMRGLETLHPKPTTQKALDLGFNLIMAYVKLPSKWIESGGKAIRFGKHPSTKNETRIVAYNLFDEPDCHNKNPQGILDLYRELKKRTDLPVGCTICGRAIGCGNKGTAGSVEEYRRQWIEVINQFDIVLPSVYPYDLGIEEGKEQEEMERCISEEWKDIRVPILPVIQAHWWKGYHLRKPNPMEQVKFWVDRGYGYITYPWKDDRNGVATTQDEWKEANKYKKEA